MEETLRPIYIAPNTSSATYVTTDYIFSFHGLSVSSSSGAEVIITDGNGSTALATYNTIMLEKPIELNGMGITNSNADVVLFVSDWTKRA